MTIWLLLQFGLKFLFTPLLFVAQLQDIALVFNELHA